MLHVSRTGAPLGMSHLDIVFASDRIAGVDGTRKYDAKQIG